VIAFARGENVITIVPRWLQRGALPKAKLTLPQGEWRNLFTGEPVSAGEQDVAVLLSSFPVALLVRS
jgi:(1->4)-alpha-D-glucan 1-alpha-D-glucosylmutase